MKQQDCHSYAKLTRYLPFVCLHAADVKEGCVQSLHARWGYVPATLCILRHTVNVLFCVATEEAIANIKREVGNYLSDNGMNNLIQFDVDCVQLIKTEEINLIKTHPGLKNVLKKDKYYDWSTILTDSYRKGKHDEPYWGFNECGLLLVLSHNTPNNTMPVIWEDTSKFRGLFPRISRH